MALAYDCIHHGHGVKIISDLPLSNDALLQSCSDQQLLAANSCSSTWFESRKHFRNRCVFILFTTISVSREGFSQIDRIQRLIDWLFNGTSTQKVVPTAGRETGSVG